jgi:hypothetical protein
MVRGVGFEQPAHVVAHHHVVPVGTQNGDAPNIRARITWAYPAALDAAATAVEVMMYKQATDRHMAYCVATTRLATALVDSVGETNKTYLKTVFPGIALKRYRLLVYG